MLTSFLENKPLIATVIRRYLLSRVEVEDLTQEVIARALEAEINREILEPKRFLIGIAKNVARSEIQRRSKSVVGLLDDVSTSVSKAEQPSVEDVVDSRKRMVVFSNAVRELPPQCRKVFVLKYIYGASHKEIASKLGIAISTVEKHVALGLRKCRKYMLEAQKGTLKDVEEMNVLGLDGRRR